MESINAEMEVAANLEVEDEVEIHTEIGGDPHTTIQWAKYHRFPNTTTVVCLAGLKNGYTVVGHSSFGDIHDFDMELSKQLAFRDAKNNLKAIVDYKASEEAYWRRQMQIAKEESSD